MSDTPERHEDEHKPIDVLDMLRENTAQQKAVEEPIEFKPKSRRKLRDYWIGMLAINGLLIASLTMGFGGNFALSGILLFSSAFT